jgi:hypothetical protein
LGGLRDFFVAGISSLAEKIQSRPLRSGDGAKNQKVGPESQERLSREAYCACFTSAYWHICEVQLFDSKWLVAVPDMGGLSFLSNCHFLRLANSLVRFSGWWLWIA